jgi:Prolyl oligopeptidase family
MRMFEDEDFQFGFELVLGATYHQSADVGEALATAARIPDGDSDAWIREWNATATTAFDAGEHARHAGRRATALSFYRRAARYYSTALYCAAKASDFGAPRVLATWRRQHECWEHTVDLSPAPGERLSIPYEGTALRGWFFRANDAAVGERRPLVIMNNGSDGSTSSMWGHGGAAAAERGYHWMTFDGPGQQSALYEQRIPFRHDWEAVLSPVVDVLIRRTDVDSERIAVIGVSQGGFWVPRALAFEHRLAAGVADTGAVDITRAWLQALPPAMRELLDAGEKDAFDGQMRTAEKASPAVTAALEFRGHPYRVTSGSRYDLFKAVESYKLGDEIKGISTPVLITDPDDEQFFPGQPQELFERLPGEKQVVRFTAAEGANGHCEPLAAGLRDARIFDWLQSHLG